MERYVPLPLVAAVYPVPWGDVLVILLETCSDSFLFTHTETRECQEEHDQLPPHAHVPQDLRSAETGGKTGLDVPPSLASRFPVLPVLRRFYIPACCTNICRNLALGMKEWCETLHKSLSYHASFRRQLCLIEGIRDVHCFNQGDAGQCWAIYINRRSLGSRW